MNVYYIFLVEGVIVLLFAFYRIMEFRRMLNPNLIKAYILMPNRRWQIFWAQKTETKNGWQIRIPKHKVAYSVSKECIDYMGIFRVPTGHWNFAKADMINMQSLEVDSATSANDYFEQNEHHAYKDMLYSLKKEFFTPAMSVLITCIIVVVAGFFLYTKLSDVDRGVKQIQQSIIPVEEVETP